MSLKIRFIPLLFIDLVNVHPGPQGLAFLSGYGSRADSGWRAPFMSSRRGSNYVREISLHEASAFDPAPSELFGARSAWQKADQCLSMFLLVRLVFDIVSDG